MKRSILFVVVCETFGCVFERLTVVVAAPNAATAIMLGIRTVESTLLGDPTKGITKTTVTEWRARDDASLRAERVRNILQRGTRFRGQSVSVEIGTGRVARRACTELAAVSGRAL